jgi:hypothetical protein
MKLRHCGLAARLFAWFAIGIAPLIGCDRSGLPASKGSSPEGGACPPNVIGGPNSCGLSSRGGGGGFGGLKSPPSFGMTDTTGSPPPISGGTLLITFDGRNVVASDPDRDAIYVVDMETRTLAFTVQLKPGDEPGRLAEDGAGRVHVALRGGGALLTMDPNKGSVLARRPACPAPRGVAWAASADLVWVACATGELVGLPSAGGAAVQSLVVERDLRDVIAQPDGTLLISKFRSAEILSVTNYGTIFVRSSLPAISGDLFAARVAWRTIAGPSIGSSVAVYQLESTGPVSASLPGGYGGGEIFGGSAIDGGSLPPPPGGFFGGSSMVGPGPSIPNEGGPAAPHVFGPMLESVLTIVGSDGTALRPPLVLSNAVLPVDVALSPDGTQFAVAAAGVGFVAMPSVVLVGSDMSTHGFVIPSTSQTVGERGPIVAVAFDGRSNLLAQMLEPLAKLFFVPAAKPAQALFYGPETSLSLSTVPNHHSGHDIFHAQAGAMIACASCHPEGGDDGHVWQLDGLPRRTPSLRGTIAGTAPYHWPGDELDMNMLIDDVYTRRMSGSELDSTQQEALTKWVEGVVPPPAPSWVDADAASRGRALFEGSAGCSACHSGAKFTNNKTVDVGTGHDLGTEADGGAPPTAFQVPPLVGVGWRAPLFHDGCANTIDDRFGRCATPQHGSTALLSPQDVKNLTAYLESL